MSLCFREAFARYRGLGSEKGTLQEYLDSHLVHLQGVRHSADTAPKNSDLHGIEAWTRAFRDVALAGDYEPLKDTSAWAQLFTACVDGNLNTFKAALETIDPTRPPNPIQPAACLAAQHSNHQILLHCFAHHGAKMDELLQHSCRLGSRTEGMMQAMYEQDWSGVRTSPDETRRAIIFFGSESLQGHWLRVHALPAKDSGSLTEQPSKSKDVCTGPECTHTGTHMTAEELQKAFGDVDW